MMIFNKPHNIDIKMHTLSRRLVKRKFITVRNIPVSPHWGVLVIAFNDDEKYIGL